MRKGREGKEASKGCTYEHVIMVGNWGWIPLGELVQNTPLRGEGVGIFIYHFLSIIG